MNSRLLISFAVLLMGMPCCMKRDKGQVVEEYYTVKKVDLRDAITQTGEVEPVIKVELKSEASGLIKEVYIKEGQRVKKGDKIIDIDPTRLLFKKEALDLSVKKALIQRALSKRNYEDGLKLTVTGTVSERDLADLKSAYELEDITYRQQLLELKDIVDQLNKTKVTSPMDGIITTLDVEVGEIAVAATMGFQGGTAIATIADISQLEVVSQIGEVDYVNLKPGQRVIIKPEAVEGAKTTGTINFIALSAKKQNADELGTFKVSITIDSLIPGIAPGINVNVEFILLSKNGVLGVPNHFVTKRHDGFFVNLVTDRGAKAEKVTMERVELGVTDFKHYEIISGLKVGDVIVFKEVIDDKKPDKNGRRE